MSDDDRTEANTVSKVVEAVWLGRYACELVATLIDAVATRQAAGLELTDTDVILGIAHLIALLGDSLEAAAHALDRLTTGRGGSNRG
jgi:hypothetical protein